MHARSARRGDQICELWSGYGEVFRVELTGGLAPTAVVKHVRPPPGQTDISDARKRRSYDVEATFYRDYAPRCDDSCRVAYLYGSRVTPDEWVFVLEDLDASGFPEPDDQCEGPTIALASLAWLAAFHARFLGDAGPGLWPTGTYWHLATRMEELEEIEGTELHTAAAALDEELAAARYQTILHGDAKPSNFCFAPGHRTAAAFDFQYAGRGCAMKDLAYVLFDHHGEADITSEEDYLESYFSYLRAAPRDDRIDIAAVEAEWRALYPVAMLDFCRFYAGWSPVSWRSSRRGPSWTRAALAARR